MNFIQKCEDCFSILTTGFRKNVYQIYKMGRIQLKRFFFNSNVQPLKFMEFSLGSYRCRIQIYHTGIYNDQDAHDNNFS